MHIDKAVFLALTSAIAASACSLTIKSGGKGAGGGTTTSSTESTTSTGSGSCSDALGTIGDCATVMTSCTESVLTTGCQGSVDQFKPGVAEKAVACIRALAATASCDDIANCRTKALAAACPDTTANDLCKKLVPTCNSAMFPLDDAGCHKLVDGLNDNGRTLLDSHCSSAASMQCTGGLANCVNFNIF